MAHAKLLIVEDEGIIARDLQHRLTRRGYTVPHTAFTGEEAIAMAGELRPDLILMDIVLQGDLDGIAAATRIRAELNIPVVFVTAYADEAVLERAKLAEPYGYILKPLHEEEIHSTIEIALYKAEMEKKLRESERRLRAIVASLDDVVFEFDAQGTYLNVWANDEQLLAAPPQQLLGRTVTDVLGEELGRLYVEAVQQVLRTEQPELLEYHLSVGTSERWFLASLHPVRWPDGTVQSVSMLARDVTVRKSLEDQLRQALKIEAVGLLAGGIAHDFNNLLTVILGFGALALEELPIGGSLGSYVQQMYTAGERAAALTAQLLAFSRRQVLQPEVLSLNTVVIETEQLLRRVLGEDLQLRLELDPISPQIFADAGQLSQILLNLASNARDAMPTGGELTLETALVDLDETYVASHGGATQAGRYVMLAVHDTGQGMDQETQTRIFEPFFTTKELGQGTGLGLSTVFGIVQQSGGDIWVESALGKGTTFRIYLPPQVDAVGDHPDDSPRERDLMPSGTETVLVVEDEPSVLLLVSTVLHALGYRVLDARDPASATRWGSSSIPIDLLMTDLVLPGQSGRLLAEQLTATRPDMKVLYMSGYTEDVKVRHGLSATRVPFLQKPFSPIALARKLREVLDAPVSPLG